MSEFEKELIKLLEKYGIEIFVSENYDSDENYIGSNYYLKGDNVFLSLEDLKDKMSK